VCCNVSEKFARGRTRLLDDITKKHQKTKEKVLGFYEKDAKKAEYLRIAWGQDYKNLEGCHYVLNSNNLIPVRLASESVSLRFLKDYCERYIKKSVLESGSNEDYVSDYDSGVENGIKEVCCELLLAASQEAKQ